MTICCYWISTRNRQFETLDNADTTDLDKAIEVAKEKIAELKKYNESATVRVIKADGTFYYGHFVMCEHTAETIRTYRVRRKSH